MSSTQDDCMFIIFMFKRVKGMQKVTIKGGGEKRIDNLEIKSFLADVFTSQSSQFHQFRFSATFSNDREVKEREEVEEAEDEQ